MDVEQMTWAIPLHVEEHHASWLGSGGEPNPKSEDVKHSEFANLVVSSHASFSYMLPKILENIYNNSIDIYNLDVNPLLPSAFTLAIRGSGLRKVGVQT